mmetsp:Transcript_35367/g.42566  ORF Transcript_35367/g.42566 Transcript_35367/m.42566 type:complete len:203 (-) Transcript_35367:1139-1747(-)
MICSRRAPICWAPGEMEAPFMETRIGVCSTTAGDGPLGTSFSESGFTPAISLSSDAKAPSWSLPSSRMSTRVCASVDARRIQFPWGPEGAAMPSTEVSSSRAMALNASATWVRTRCPATCNRWQSGSIAFPRRMLALLRSLTAQYRSTAAAASLPLSVPSLNISARFATRDTLMFTSIQFSFIISSCLQRVPAACSLAAGVP